MRKVGCVCIVLLFLVACQQQDEGQPEAGKVYPSPAYLSYFGEPPAVRRGFAYAHVAFLPDSESPGRVTPVPLFLFSEQQPLELILKKMFSDNLLLSPRSKLLAPFALGVRLKRLEHNGQTLSVYLETVGSDSIPDQAGIDRAVTETAAQFEQVSRVKIFYNELISDQQPEAGYQQQAESILPPGPPDLIDLVASWEPDSENPKEILARFDRPVSIGRFKLFRSAGKPVAGKYYTAIFDMAVVLLPAHPEAFQQGMALQVSWDVTDRLGRHNSGNDDLQLRRVEH